MTTKNIIKELTTLLPVKYISQLEFQVAIEPSVGLCMIINTIVTEFNSSQDIENRVCKLLCLLVKNHFSKIK